MGVIKRDKRYYFMQAWMLDVGKHKLPDLADFRPIWEEAERLGIETYEEYLEYKKEQDKAPVNNLLKRKLVTEGQKTKSKYRFIFYSMNQFQSLFDEKNAYDGHTNFMYALNHVDRLERDVIAESEEEAYKLFRKDHSEKVFEIEEVIYIGKVKVDN